MGQCRKAVQEGQAHGPARKAIQEGPCGGARDVFKRGSRGIEGNCDRHRISSAGRAKGRP